VSGERQAVLERLRSDARFVLLAHESPDGDAIGSLVATQGLLTALGKDSVMYVSPADLPLAGEYRALSLGGLVKTIPADVAERTVIFLDCGNIDRNSAAPAVAAAANTINIDHHHDNTRFGTVNLVEPGASCTAEIIWGLAGELGVSLTRDMCEALYIALITDTGRFMYDNTTSRSHMMAADLLSQGVDVEGVYRRLYEDMPTARLELLAIALGRIERYDFGVISMTTLAADDFRAVEADESHSEGVIDELRKLGGTKVAAFVREVMSGPHEGQWKVSLRATDDDVDVSLIAREQGGGGHRRAAGFVTTLPHEELVAFLRGAVALQLDGTPAATVG